MGTKIPTPEHGNDCAACFSAGETPEFIWVMFDGVKVGDPPGSYQVPNGCLFKCVQSEIDPCLWEYNPSGPGWVCSVYRSVATGRWHVTLTVWAGGSHFTGWRAGCPSEHDIFANVYWSPIWWHGWDGVATIMWMTTVLALLDALVIPQSNTLMEMFLIDELKTVYKFCNRKYSINQCIEIE